MNHALAATCACITGITVGLTAHHKLQLDSVTQLKVAPQQFLPATEEIADSNNLESNNTDIPQSDISLTPSVNDLVADANDRMAYLEDSIQMLIKQQKFMANQQSELNRELNSIQFRLDTHSASFRPMRSERETNSIPRESNSNTPNPLLPPRN